MIRLVEHVGQMLPFLLAAGGIYGFAIDMDQRSKEGRR